MLGAAAAFGAPWYLERDDHDQISHQLSTRDARLADEKKAHDATNSQLSAAEKARTDAESKVTELTPCSDAGKELARLALAQASEEEAPQAGATLVVACEYEVTAQASWLPINPLPTHWVTDSAGQLAADHDRGWRSR